LSVIGHASLNDIFDMTVAHLSLKFCFVLVSAAVNLAIPHVQTIPHRTQFVSQVDPIADEGQACYDIAGAIPALTTLTGANAAFTVDSMIIYLL
jgi:hypothetical protein